MSFTLIWRKRSIKYRIKDLLANCIHIKLIQGLSSGLNHSLLTEDKELELTVFFPMEGSFKWNNAMINFRSSIVYYLY